MSSSPPVPSSITPPSADPLADLQRALPPTLRGPGTRIAPIAVGMSGAAVYRIETRAGAYVMKVTGGETPQVTWRERLRLQRLASDAGVAPRLVHVDEDQKAIVSEWIVDRSLPALLFHPSTRSDAIALLGRTLRRVHELPVPANAPIADPQAFLGEQWTRLSMTATPPAFAAEAVRRGLAEEPPAIDRPVVMSHNDANPTNLVYDGERLLLLDWETLAPNDWCYDLATVALFLRFDDTASLSLLAAHEGRDVTELPARFLYDRRMVALVSGVAALNAACAAGPPKVPESADGGTPLALAEAYAAMRSGALDLRTSEGQWRFGVALIGAAFDEC